MLLDALLFDPVHITVCVATEYGQDALQHVPGAVTVRAGRMDEMQMQALMRTGFTCAIDATHPYAVDASRTIAAAAASASIPYLRVQRPRDSEIVGEQVASVSDAVAHLQHAHGNILATTGAKELDAYTLLPNFAARVFPRVLPCIESIARCMQLGFLRSHIIAMQGPFSKELNIALIHQYDIGFLVTKDGGGVGGFEDKVRAATACGIGCVVVGRPQEVGGMSVEAAVAWVRGVG